MHPKILYYVTGHGFGHARRSAEVARALLETNPDVEVHFRTSLAPHILAPWLDPRVRVSWCSFDPGAVEESPFRIDVDRTLEAVRRSLDEAPAAVAGEAAFVAREGFTLILSDAPFLAGDVAAAAGVPCVAITNFTWDWIYEPLFADRPGAEELLARIGASYARMELLLRLPFAGGGATLPRVIDVPLVVAPQRRTRAEIRAQVPLPEDGRPRILLGQRGGLNEATQLRACREAPHLLFVALQPPVAPASENLRVVPLHPGLRFEELLRACEVVVSKPGWGILTDCIASGTALLWPPRFGFREDDVSLPLAAPALRMQHLAPEPFQAGEWRDALDALLAQPAPTHPMRTDGAQEVARWLLSA